MRKSVLLGLALTSGLTILTMSPSSFAAPQCSPLFTAEVVSHHEGFLAKRIQGVIERENKYLEKAEKIAADLKLGGDGWQPVDPVLVSKIQASMNEYNHTHFDVMSAQMHKAIADIETALVQSPQFKSLPVGSLKTVVQVIASNGRNTKLRFVNAEHILNHVRSELNLVSSVDLQQKMLQLQENGRKVIQMSQSIYELQTINNIPEIKALKSPEEFLALYDSTQASIQKMIAMPAEVSSKWLEAASEYRKSYQDQPAAREKFNKLLNEQSFFGKLDPEAKKDYLLSGWYNVKNSREASLKVAYHSNRNADLQRELVLYDSLDRMTDTLLKAEL